MGLIQRYEPIPVRANSILITFRIDDCMAVVGIPATCFDRRIFRAMGGVAFAAIVAGKHHCKFTPPAKEDIAVKLLAGISFSYPLGYVVLFSPNRTITRWRGLLEVADSLPQSLVLLLSCGQ